MDAKEAFHVMLNSREIIRITHLPSGTRLAEGPLGWGITPFEEK